MTDQVTALEVAETVFEKRFKPAVRLMVAELVDAAKQGQSALDVYARVVDLMAQAGRPLVPADELLGPLQDALKTACAAFVKAGLVAPNDPIFDGFAL